MALEKLMCYKVAIYVRESRDDNEENYETIETQKGLLIDFAEKNKLGNIVEVYIDDNVSGSMFERKGIEKLKSDIMSHRVDLLLLKDLSRLGRNNAKTLMFLDFLEECGVRVLTYDGRYDSIKDNDTVGIETWFNERYIRDISRKIRANLKFKIAKGEYIGHAPYGYKKSDEEKNRLVVDESKAYIVKEIYGMYLMGYGYAHIAKQLDQKGYLPPGAKSDISYLNKGWNAAAVKRILGNRVYIGDTVQGVSEKISFKSKKTRRLPEEMWVVTENTHNAIISREEFYDVQKLRREKRSGLGPHKGNLHLFRGLLYCGKCGSVMFARQRRDRPMGYICGNYAKKGREGCTSHYVAEDELLDIIKYDMVSLLSDEGIKHNLKRLIEKDLQDKNAPKCELAELERLLKEKQRQQEVLYIDKLEGRISEQLFTRMNTNLENRITLLENGMEKIKSSKPTALNGDEIIDFTAARVRDGIIPNGVIKLLIKRIMVIDAGDVDGNCEKNIGDAKKQSMRENGGLIVEYRF